MNPLRILLVEDNPADVDLLRESLEESTLDAVLTVARSGAEAWGVLSGAGETGDPPPDIVLLDLNLPGVDGRQILGRMRADERYRTCPVVVLTSSEAERDIVQSYELGANCYVVKPLEFESYMAVMKVLESFWLRIAKLPSIARR